MAKKYLPEGSSDQAIATTLKNAVVMLNREPDIQKGGLYHTLTGAMQERFAKLGIINVPEFVLLMQELGLLRHRGGGKTVTWQVICVTFFEEIISPPWLERAQACLVSRAEMNKSIRVLRDQVVNLETKHKNTPVGGGKSFEEIAEMVVTIERLEADLCLRNERVSQLEKELAQQEVVDYDAILAAAIKRVRERTA